MYDKKIRLKSEICLKGHILNSDLKLEENKEFSFCPTCGSKVIDKCPECGAPILGKNLFQKKRVTGFIIDGKDCTSTHYRDEKVSDDFVLPNYCQNCGKPYPWTITFLDNYKKILEFDSLNLDQKLKETIYLSTENLLKDNFSITSQYATMLKTIISPLTSFTKEVIINSFSNLASDAIKEFLNS